MRSSYFLVVIVMDSRSSSLSSGCEEKLGETFGSGGVLSFLGMGEHDCSKLSNNVCVNCVAITEVAGTKSVPRIPVNGGGCPPGWVAVASIVGGRVVSVMTEVSVPGVINCRFVRIAYGDCITLRGGGAVPGVTAVAL